jgi:putative N6-adenine-specific DNA methylase
MSLFIMCGRGLEDLLAEELITLGCKNPEPGFCGVGVKESSMDFIYAINYRSRLASRVLLPLLEFNCKDQKALYNKAREIDWSLYIKPHQSLAIDANVHHHALRNSLFAAQVMKDAICDNLREHHDYRPTIDLKNPDVQLNLFINNNDAIISLDTSGQPLHKRGYRQAAGAAPLQETLAAALLKLARFNNQETITIDPCCGSGTLLIEAALQASNTPAGYLRTKWGFFAHPHYNQQQWLDSKRQADSHIIKLSAGLFWGCEHDASVVEICEQNIRRAGFADDIQVTCADFTKYQPETPCNFLITNPPHGKRLGTEENLVRLYRSLGDFMKQHLAKPARAFVFTSSNSLAKQIGLATKKRHIITTGGIDARLLEFDIYEQRANRACEKPSDSIL